MYAQLQEEARKYIITSLNKISSQCKFDIDTSKNEIVIDYKFYGTLIKAPIEQIQKYIPLEIIADVTNLYGIESGNSKKWLGCLLIRHWIQDIFQIYRVNISCFEGRPTFFKVLSKNKTVVINSRIFETICECKDVNFVSPFGYDEYCEYLVKEQFVSPILLLLDPITYFRRYSEIIMKYPRLNKGHTLGIYELLLGYFPEMNCVLFEKYLAVYWLFGDVCCDIVLVIGGIFVELYV